MFIFVFLSQLVQVDTTSLVLHVVNVAVVIVHYLEILLRAVTVLLFVVQERLLVVFQVMVKPILLSVGESRLLFL